MLDDDTSLLQDTGESEINLTISQNQNTSLNQRRSDSTYRMVSKCTLTYECNALVQLTKLELKRHEMLLAVQ